MTDSVIGFEHNVELTKRNSLVVTGINGVNSFDENQISVSVCSGETLFVEGVDLDIKEVNLQKGILEAAGKISGLYYEDLSVQKNGSFLRSLIKKS